MSLSYRLRWSGMAAMVGGVLLVVAALLDPEPGQFRVPSIAGDMIVMVEVLLLIGLAGLYARLEKSSGHLGRAGFLVAMIGGGLAVAGLVLNDRIGVDPGEWLFAYELSAVSVGLVLIGLDAVRSHSALIWRPLPLMLGLLGFVVLFGFGFPGLVPDVASRAVFGTGWVLLGCSLWTDPAAASRRGSSTEATASARPA
jgi:hypothetical protein